MSDARSSEVWTAWLARVGPAGATMSLVRLAAIVLAAYLLALVVIEVVGRAIGLPRLLALGHGASTPLARRLIGGVAGVGLALSFATATVVPAGAAPIDTPSTTDDHHHDRRPARSCTPSTRPTRRPRRAAPP